jgi:hypothetical protein
MHVPEEAEMDSRHAPLVWQRALLFSPGSQAGVRIAVANSAGYPRTWPGNELHLTDDARQSPHNDENVALLMKGDIANFAARETAGAGKIELAYGTRRRYIRHRARYHP